jgi:hypothetical protein
MYYRLNNQLICKYTLVLKCLKQLIHLDIALKNIFTFDYLWSKIRSCKNIHKINQMFGPHIQLCLLLGQEVDRSAYS